MKNLYKLSLLLASVMLLEACGANKPSSSSNSGSSDLFTNGGFELGNLEGWSTTGMAFSDEDVTNESTINGVDSNKTGDYFFHGSKSSLASARGTLTSGVFRVDGTGYVSYKIGAAKDASKIYLEFFEDGKTEPLSFKANGSDDEITKIGNEDFDAVYRSDTLITNYVDLTAHKGKDLRVVITDNDTNDNSFGDDYSYVNFDDFKVITTNIGLESAKTERETDLKTYSSDFEEDPTSTTLRNGSFENGLDGWKVMSGDALTQDDVVLATSGFWGNRSFHATGNYLLSGEAKNGGRVGTVRSEKFTIESTDGNKYVSFKFGGAKRSTCYIALCDGTTGEELSKVTNDKIFSDPSCALNMFLHVLDVTQYKGRVLYFSIVDQDRSTEGFDFLTCDDFRINLSEDEAKALIADTKTEIGSYDDTDKTTYTDVYNNKLSFEIAGNAPIINVDGLDGGYLYTTEVEHTDSYNFLSLADAIKDTRVGTGSEHRITDDYTAFNDLSLTVESVSYNDGEATSENLSNFDISEAGSYIVNFKVKDAYDQEASGKALVTSVGEIVTPTTITNGGFETGDLTGWTATGEAFADSEVLPTTSKFWSTREYHGVGNYLFDGSGLEGKIGTLKSSTFKIDESEGDKYISFLMGAAASSDNYIAICSAEDDSELVKVTNNYFKDPQLSLNMVRHYVNVSDHKGQDVYIKIVDATTSGFGFVTFDDFQVNLSVDEIKALYAQTKDSSNYESDEVAKESYIDVYQNQISLDVAGDAPVITKDDSTLEIAFSETKNGTESSYDLTKYIDSIKKHVSDDYTAKNDLTISITSVTKPDSTKVTSGFDAFDLSAAGNYEVEFSVVDAFNQTSTGKFELVVTNTVVNEIENGGFETGDMTGWTLKSGTFNMSSAVSSDSTFWGEQIPFNKTGTYFVNGWNAGAEGDVWEVQSSTFTLAGSGYISFKMAGRAAVLNVYDADTNTKIASYKNTAFKDNGVYVSNGSRLGTMTTFVADLSSHIGEKLYITIQDTETSNWGVAFFDAIVVNNQTAIDVTGKYDTVSQPNAEGVTVETQIPWAIATNTIS